MEITEANSKSSKGVNIPSSDDGYSSPQVWSVSWCGVHLMRQEKDVGVGQTGFHHIKQAATQTHGASTSLWITEGTAELSSVNAERPY